MRREPPDDPPTQQTLVTHLVMILACSSHKCVLDKTWRGPVWESHSQVRSWMQCKVSARVKCGDWPRNRHRNTARTASLTRKWRKLLPHARLSTMREPCGRCEASGWGLGIVLCFRVACTHTAHNTSETTLHAATSLQCILGGQHSTHTTPHYLLPSPCCPYLPEPYRGSGWCRVQRGFLKVARTRAATLNCACSQSW